MLQNLDVSRNLPTFALESPLGCEILGSVAEKQLRKINPARMRYAEAQVSERGLYF